MSARRDQARDGRRQSLQRRQQDIGEDQIERRGFAEAMRRQSGRDDDVDQRRGPVAPRILARGDHGLCVDIARQHVPAQQSRGGDGEHAGAGSDIENAPRRFLLGDGVERQQAAARGAMMAGAEGERGLDLDADAMRGNLVAVMRAVNDEAAGIDGFEAFAGSSPPNRWWRRMRRTGPWPRPARRSHRSGRGSRSRPADRGNGFRPASHRPPPTRTPQWYRDRPFPAARPGCAARSPGRRSIGRVLWAKRTLKFSPLLLTGRTAAKARLTSPDQSTGLSTAFAQSIDRPRVSRRAYFRARDRNSCPDLSTRPISG